MLIRNVLLILESSKLTRELNIFFADDLKIPSKDSPSISRANLGKEVKILIPS